MRKKLTTKTIEALSHNGPKRLKVWDVTLPGFGIRVSPGGSKSWFCTTRQGGRSRRVTLRPYPRVTLSEAREIARKVMSDARNRAPDTPHDEQAAITLGEAKQLFIELYAKPKNRHWRGAERLLDLKFESLFKQPLRSIARPQVVRILDEMVSRGRMSSANHALSAIKKLMNWAHDRGMVDVNSIAACLLAAKKCPGRASYTTGKFVCFWMPATTKDIPLAPCIASSFTPANAGAR